MDYLRFGDEGLAQEGWTTSGRWMSVEVFVQKRAWLVLDAVCSVLGVVMTFTVDWAPGGWIFSVLFAVHLAWLLAGVVVVRDEAVFIRSWRG